MCLFWLHYLKTTELNTDNYLWGCFYKWILNYVELYLVPLFIPGVEISACLFHVWKAEKGIPMELNYGNTLLQSQ